VVPQSIKNDVEVWKVRHQRGTKLIDNILEFVTLRKMHVCLSKDGGPVMHMNEVRGSRNDPSQF
jgi:hypothetical protein